MRGVATLQIFRDWASNNRDSLKGLSIDYLHISGTKPVHMVGCYLVLDFIHWRIVAITVKHGRQGSLCCRVPIYSVSPAGVVGTKYTLEENVYYFKVKMSKEMLKPEGVRGYIYWELAAALTFRSGRRWQGAGGMKPFDFLAIIQSTIITMLSYVRDSIAIIVNSDIVVERRCVGLGWWKQSLSLNNHKGGCHRKGLLGSREIQRWLSVEYGLYGHYAVSLVSTK